MVTDQKRTIVVLGPTPVTTSLPIRIGTSYTQTSTEANPITLKGENGGILKRTSSGGSLLEVYGPSYVILGADLTLEINSAAGQSGVSVAGATLDIKGAVIQGNSTSPDSSPSGIKTGDAGGATIYLSTGTISGFGRNGVLLDGSYPNYFYMRGGTISNNKMGGVHVNDRAYFNMLGGVISDNQASSLGGGVKVDGGLFTMTAPALITHNTASSMGGGVFVDNGGVFTMNSGTISDNTAVTMGGGGVTVHESYSRFNMAGGTISGNSSSKVGYVYGGGGVEVASGSTFTMSGGTISGNYADFGAGVLVQADAKFVMLGNSARITDNERFGTVVTLIAGVWIVPNTSIPHGQFVKSGGTITTEGTQNVAVIAASASAAYTVQRKRTPTAGTGTDGNLDMDNPSNWDVYQEPD
jgi:hypothetical protein